MSIADICAFIASEEVRLADKYKSELNGITLLISTKGARVWAYGTRDSDRYSYKCAEGLTPDEAAEVLCAEHFPAPKRKAAILRDEARELLRAAAELDREDSR